MSRLRKLDRAILDQNGPIDIDDQDLLITQLRQKNDESFALYTKVLALSIVVELPILLWLAKTADLTRTRTLISVIMILSSLLSLMILLYDVNVLGNHLLVHINGRVRSAKLALLIRFIFSYKGVNILNSVLLLQLGGELRKLGLKGMYCVVPAGNLIMALLVRRWHTEIKGNVKELDGLKYDYKTV